MSTIAELEGVPADVVDDEPAPAEPEAAPPVTTEPAAQVDAMRRARAARATVSLTVPPFSVEQWHAQRHGLPCVHHHGGGYCTVRGGSRRVE